MSYEEKTLYKDRKAIQYCKEGLVCELGDVAEKLMIAATTEDIVNLLNALTLDIQVVLDAVEQSENTKRYFAKKEAEQ
jgi:hypothetical protein